LKKAALFGTTIGRRGLFMAVQFILGRAGTGKTRLCIEAAAQALREDSRQPLILLVPEQATYQMEQAVLSLSGIEGYHRLRILSFQRLGYWLEPAGGRWELSRVGRQMIVQRLMADCQPQLKLLNSTDEAAGSAAQMADVLAQLYRAQATPTQLAEMARLLAERDPAGRTALKLGDLAVLLEAYQQFLGQNQDFYDAEHLFSRLCSRIAQADFLKNACLWVDGFAGFTAHEEAVLLELLKVCSQSHIALCLEPSILEGEPSESWSIFAPTRRTYLRLRERIEQANLPPAQPIILDKPYRWRQTPALKTLERYFPEEFAPASFSCGGAIVLAAFPDVRSECLWTARRIRQLVRQENLRYRQIAVVVPEMASYQHLLTWAFGRLEIPYFLDQPRPLRTHPAAELLDSALRAVCFHFRLPDMMAFLKTGLLGLTDFQADLLDNYCRACGIEGADWLSEQPWKFADPQEGFPEGEIDSIRRQAAAPLLALRRNLRIEEGGLLAPEEFVKALWEFLETLQVRQTLALWAEDDPSDQRFGHRQMWQKLVQVFDELCIVYQNRRHPAAVYQQLLQSALSTLTVKLIPPTLDQVLIGQIERSRHPEIQVVFLLGATQKQFPAPLESEGFFSRDDRAVLESLDADFAEPLDRQLLRRCYLSYIALTRAQRQVYLTRPLADEKGSPIQPWGGLEKLRQLFSDLQTLKPAAEPQSPEEIQTCAEWALYLCQTLGQDSTAESSGRAAAGALLEGLDSPAARTVREALEYRNQAQLEESLVRQVYGGSLSTSISRLESLAACPYRHFASYLLRLKKRRLVHLEPLDLGLFYHAVLNELFKTVSRQGLDWAEVPPTQLEKMVREVSAGEIARSEFLQSFQRHSAHNRFLLQTACEQLVRLAAGLREMLAAGSFRPLQTEVNFGTNGLPPLLISPAGGAAVRLRGVIDRVDSAQTPEGTAAVVFDYKTSSRDFQWDQWFYGLDIQMPVYLLALRGQTLAGQTLVHPAGAFYIPIQSSIKFKELSELDKPGQFPFKAKGFLDERFARLLIDPAQKSGYYNFSFNKEGQLARVSQSGILTPEQFERFLSATQSILQNLAGQLFDGCIEIAPYRLGRTSPCSYCDYRPVCKFDWEINSYRFLPSLKKTDVLEKLEEGQP